MSGKRYAEEFKIGAVKQVHANNHFYKTANAKRELSFYVEITLQNNRCFKLTNDEPLLLMKTLTLLLILLPTTYILGGLFLYFKQDNFIYFPPENIQHPYPLETFENQGQSIEVITLNPGKNNALLYFAGSGELVAQTAPSFSNRFPSHTIYLVNYRGYGNSSGNPSEQGFNADALHIFDVIQPRHQHITVLGRSIGSGVATYLASQRKIEKLVLVTPYDSILSVAQDQYPFYPISLLLRDTFDSIHRIKNFTTPTLVLIAEFDELIPYKNSKRMIDVFPVSQVVTHMIKDTDHNSILNQETYFHHLETFLDK